MMIRDLAAHIFENSHLDETVTNLVQILVVCAPLWDGFMRGAVGVEQRFRYRA